MGGCHCEDENPEMKKSTEERVRQDLGDTVLSPSRDCKCLTKC